MIDNRRVLHRYTKQWILLAVFVTNVTSVRCLTEQRSDQSKTSNLWSQQTEADLRELARLMRTRYIYGVYDGDPGYPNYFSTLERAEKRAHTEALAAENPLDYQFVIKHFLASFDDPHIWIDFVTVHRPISGQVFSSPIEATSTLWRLPRNRMCWTAHSFKAATEVQILT